LKELIIFCEGQTEQRFCARLLQPHLFPTFDGIIHTFPVGGKNDHHIYGVVKYGPLQKFIRNTLLQRTRNDIRFTTLIDLYAIPGDFPGKSTTRRDPSNPTPYVEALEQAFGADIDDYRFIPHIQLYEYETMLYSDPEAFRISFENIDIEVSEIHQIVRSVPSIEHINDHKNTAPSRRIIQLIPEYRGSKTTAGVDIADFLGLQLIRSKCPHFDRWLTKLEKLFPQESEAQP